MTGGAASDTAIYSDRWTHNRIRFSALLTTAQNSANVEMGRSLVAKKKLLGTLCHNRHLSEVLIISLILEEGRRIFANSISANHVLAPLQYTDLNGHVFLGSLKPQHIS